MWLFLVLLDLSATFDTVDHSKLWYRFKRWVGTVLERFSSYLNEWRYSETTGRFDYIVMPV